MASPVEQAKRLGAIAIVGIASELPSGKHSASNLDHEEFFRMLLEKKETYEKVPEDRFDVERWFGDSPGQIKVDTGSFLKNLGDFDNTEFGVTAKDAKTMAVSTRKLLQLSFLSLLDSGIDYRARHVGCFMSAVEDPPSLSNIDIYDTRASFAGIPCMSANKVSYHLDLLGPSFPLNTACSSSLTALHLGVQSVRSGECDAALVGGCQLNHRLVDWFMYDQGSVLAPDGKCKPFDAHADGFSRGEGAAVIVIKPLEDAIRDKDHIYASILGTGINASGLGGPVSAPVAEAQKDAMIQAFRGTGRHPSEVDFVELHATGTAAGDPTEANWVGESFRRDSDILVGSVKGNIGHLEITAFLASLVKVCSMFDTGLIPPSVNLTTLNPKIKWDEYRLRVVTDVTHLGARHESGRSLISIASSGIGGSNGHAVLEAPPERTAVHPLGSEKRPVLLAVGGLSLRSILALCEKVSNDIPNKSYEDLAALAAISGRRARQVGWRSIVIRAPEDTADPEFSFPVLAPRKRAPLAFVFAGQGPQYLEMGRELFQNYAAFRESILSLDEVYKKEVGVSLIESTGLFIPNKLAPDLPSTWPISITLPAMSMLQVAMVDLLGSINIFPDIVVGFSAGETSMLYPANAASKELVMALAIARGRAMTAVEEADGGMAALSCSPSKAMSIIVEVAGGASKGLDIACYNTPEAVTIAGRNELVDLAVKSAENQGIFARRLRTNVAVHSHLMEICKTQYKQLVEDVFDRYGPVTGPTKAVYSTKTGRIWREAFTADYYWSSARGPVNLSDAVSDLLKDHPNVTFLEVSPHPVLSAYLRDMAPSNTVLCPMERPRKPKEHHETTTLLSTVGQLLVKGYNKIDFAALNGFSVVPRTPFESLVYPLSKKQVPYFRESDQPLTKGLDNGPAVARPKVFKINSQTYPDLAQHVIKGEPIMPATGFIDMSLSQGAREIHDVQFRSMLSLSSHDPLLVKLETDGTHWSIVSSEASGTKAKKVHAEGYYTTGKQNPDENQKPIDIQSIIARCTPIDTKDFYEQLRYFADYGPLFQRVVDCYKGEEEAVARVRGLDKDLQETKGKYIVHPAILDACLHLGVHRIFTGDANDQVYYLPSSVESVVVYDPLVSKGMPEEVFVHISLRSWKPDALSFDCTVVDDKGTRLCQISGLSISKHRSAKKTAIDHCYDIKNEKLPIEAMYVNGVDFHALAPKDIVVHYVQGGEMQVKAKLLPINRYEKRDIWILASNDTTGGGARGLTRTLRREVPSWNIRLVLFPTETPADYRLSALANIKEQIPSENEIILDVSGDILVPRIVESTPSKQLLKGSSSTVQFHSEKAYLLLGGVGSLGIRVALWMYEHGARHIILTSRNGMQSKALEDTLTKRILSYLQGRADAAIRVEKCNISSVEDTKSLFHSIEQPIGGCMLLATALSDRPFFSQTADSFAMPFATKTQAFLALKDSIDISKLDFLISFSTASTFGNFGQANYASANTALDEMIRTVPNAFSIILPLISDSTVAVVAGGNLSTLAPWAISSDDLCEYLEDALLRFEKERSWLYIPDIDWNSVNKHMGPSLLYEHLVVHENKEVKKSGGDDKAELIRSIVMKYVEVDPEDFFASAPLSSYGLDSLTAAQLSSDLEPFLVVTQVQLLAGISLDEILKRAEEESGGSGEATKEPSNKGGKFVWSEMNKAGETLVKLRDGPEIPLILIHGSSGDILPFKPLQDFFTTPLWAIQLTPDVPTQSVPELAKFYYDKIKKARPEGPYRLAGYSGTSVVTYEVAHLIESNGDELKQLVFIDHFPSLLHSPMFRVDEETVNSGKPSRALVAQVINAVAEVYRRDKNPTCKRIASALSGALAGGEVTRDVKNIMTVTEDFVAISAKFVLDLAGGEISKIPEALRTWVRQINAPVTLYIARDGNLRCMPESEQEAWKNFRATQWIDNIEVRLIDDSHFGMLENIELSRGLEKHW